MSGLDRNRLVDLLRQLGDETDETVLAAAREASRLVSESGQDWSEVIGGVECAALAEPAAMAASPGDKSGDQKLVERLLARSDISDTLRGDLEEFRRQIAAGTLDRMDADYIRALAKRLGA